MAFEKPTDSLSEDHAVNAPIYDFLYRDSNRLASYSAQIFGGVAQSLERTGTIRKTDDKRTQVGSMSVALHEQKHSSEDAQAQKETTLPHDIVASDVLSHLLSTGRVARDITGAPHGSLVLAQGTAVFLDRNIVQTAALVTSKVSEQHEKFQISEVTEEGQATVNFSLEQLFTNFLFPSAFLLCTPENLQICGTLKDDGMEEPISTYYFKHGSAGISEVYLVGIKEISNNAKTLADSNLLGIVQNLAQNISEFFLPPDAFRVTPIAIFRKL